MNTSRGKVEDSTYIQPISRTCDVDSSSLPTLAVSDTGKDHLKQIRPEERVPYFPGGNSSSGEYSSPNNSSMKLTKQVGSRQTRSNVRKHDCSTIGQTLPQKELGSAFVSEKEDVQFKLEPIDNISRPSYVSLKDEVQQHRMQNTNWKKGILQRHTADVLKTENGGELTRDIGENENCMNKSCTESPALNEVVPSIQQTLKTSQYLCTSYPLSHIYAAHKSSVNYRVTFGGKPQPVVLPIASKVLSRSYHIGIQPPAPVPPPKSTSDLPVSPGPPPTSIPLPISRPFPHFVEPTAPGNSPIFPNLPARSARKKVT